MTTKKMEQTSGSDSTNIQVAGNAQFGLSYDDVKKVSLDIFKANFYELSESASKKAMERVVEMTEKFLKAFFEDNNSDKTKLEDPAVQSSIYEAQRAYARTGDKQLEQRLLDTLIARIGSDERHINQIVLDEAITILPKLTDGEVNLLSLVVSLTKVQYQGINSISAFNTFFVENVLKFFPEKISAIEGSHLQYCGCYTLPMTNGPIAYYSLGEYLGARYKGLFTNGFSEQQFVEETNGMKLADFGDFIIKNLRNQSVYQFSALHDSEFNNRVSKFGLGDRTKLLKAIWDKSAMNKEQVEKALIDIDSRADKLIFSWNRTTLPAMQLSPVGYAIAVINLNRVINGKLDFWAFI